MSKDCNSCNENKLAGMISTCNSCGSEVCDFCGEVSNENTLYCKNCHYNQDVDLDSFSDDDSE